MRRVLKNRVCGGVVVGVCGGVVVRDKGRRGIEVVGANQADGGN